MAETLAGFGRKEREFDASIGFTDSAQVNQYIDEIPDLLMLRRFLVHPTLYFGQ